MTVFILDLEKVETRYTGEWQTHIPNLLKKNGLDVCVISGPTNIPNATTPGAFLNFGGTNIYKANQIEQISRLFCDGGIKAGDQFLFTDAWHPGIINLKYMSELLQIPVVTHGLWHAGSYDSQDFLGRLIGNASWVRHAEKSFYHCFDHNYFATNFHIDMFEVELFQTTTDDWLAQQLLNHKLIRSGWPMEYMENLLLPYKNMEKKNLILFPHRIAPEKQVEIFRDLKEQLTDYEFVVCQDAQLSKNEYHNLLGEAKIVFSANLQETLGISCYEGAIVGAIPMVPDRLSYKEMYNDEFKYPSEWTHNFESYKTHRKEICDKIVDSMENYNKKIPSVQLQANSLSENFFSANKLVKTLTSPPK